MVKGKKNKKTAAAPEPPALGISLTGDDFSADPPGALATKNVVVPPPLQPEPDKSAPPEEHIPFTTSPAHEFVTFPGPPVVPDEFTQDEHVIPGAFEFAPAADFGIDEYAPVEEPAPAPIVPAEEPAPKKTGMFRSLFGKKNKEEAAAPANTGWSTADLAGGWANDIQPAAAGEWSGGTQPAAGWNEPAPAAAAHGGRGSGWGVVPEPASATDWGATGPETDWAAAPDDTTAAYGMPYNGGGTAKSTKSPAVRTAATTPWTLVPDEISVAEDKKKKRKNSFKFWLPSRNNDSEDEDEFDGYPYEASQPTSQGKKDKKKDKKGTSQQDAAATWTTAQTQSASYTMPAGYGNDGPATDWEGAEGNDWSTPAAAAATDWTTQQPPKPAGKTPKSGHARTSSFSDWEQYGVWPTQGTATPHPTSGKKEKEKTSKSKKKTEATPAPVHAVPPETAFYGDFPAYYRTPKAAAATTRTPSLAYAMWGAPTPGSSRTPKLPPEATPNPALYDPFHGAFAVASTHGAATEEAHRALYGRHRPSVGRLHWGMPPQKDDRVYECMLFIQDPQVRNELCDIAVKQFVMHRQPGCFFLNAAFRLGDRPSTPGFDWMTYDQLQSTYDRCIQQSLMYYDPATVALVFIFLVSPTGNSMAIWRRKIAVHPHLGARFGPEIEKIKREMRESQYQIMVDTPPDVMHSWGMSPAAGLGMGFSTPFPASNMGFAPETPMQGGPARGAWFSTGYR